MTATSLQAITAGATSLKVSRRANGEPEIFISIQGEGASLGTPTVFLRLALCNLACTWCDTRYTWDWQLYDYDSEVMELAVTEVEDRILGYDCRHLVITGGEPLLQQRTLAPLAQSLLGEGFRLEVETNGTIVPSAQLRRHVHQWNVSPKLRSSGNGVKPRRVNKALADFGQMANSYFKFVMVGPPDVQEVRDLCTQYQLPRDRVLLMPEGRARSTLRQRSLWLTQVCIEEGFRYSPRLHIDLWGDTRGT